MSIHAYGVSFKGNVRQRNEDAFRIDEDRGIYIISDGMGGKKAGHVASNLATDEAIQSLQSIPVGQGIGISDLEEALRKANHAVLDMSTNIDELSGMGCTMIVLALHGNEVKYCHCGDSRAYLYRQGALKQITKDHTLAQHRLDKGEIDEAEAEHSPDQHVLMQALGLAQAEIDPDFGTFLLENADMVLLCSDGLSGYVDEEEIVSVLDSYRFNLNRAARVLIESAERARSTDNITVLLVEYTQ